MPKANVDHPKVTIITVVLNGAKHLQEAMESVVNQDYPNIEYIVLDGGSTDGSLEIIKEYESNVSYWHSKRDGGLYHAMNTGIKMATGEIIGLLNSDDVLYPRTVSRVVGEIGDSPESKYTCGTVDLMSEDGTIFGSSSPLPIALRLQRKFLEMPCPHLSVFVGRDVYTKIGVFNTEFRFSADYDFLLRLITARVPCRDLSFTVGAFRSGGLSGGSATWTDTRSVLKKHGVSLVHRNYVFARSRFRALLMNKLPVEVVRSIKRFTTSKNTYKDN